MRVFVLGELYRLAVDVSVMIHSQRGFELMWLRYFLGRFPIAASVSEYKSLSAPIVASGFKDSGIAKVSGQAKVWRNSGLEDRQVNHSVLGVDPLKLRTVDRIYAF